MAFDLSNYVQVNERVAKFYKQYINGRIHTRIIRLDDERVVVEAKVWKVPPEAPKDPTTLSDKALEVFYAPDGVGQAEEVRLASVVNKTSALENAETSAIGRALAHMGFEVQKSLSSREAASGAKEAQEALSKPATEAQKQMIYTMLERLALTPEFYEKEIGTTIDSLTGDEALTRVAKLKTKIQRDIAIKKQAEA